MNIQIRVKNIPAAELAQDVDLGAYTDGWHDEWFYDPAYAQQCWQDPRFFSNTPAMGIGNSFYKDEEQFYAHFGSVVAALTNREEFDPANHTFKAEETCAFLHVLPDGSGKLYEIAFE